ncbi:hypothetical protein C8235_08150, partial [Paracidovorax avenae]
CFIVVSSQGFTSMPSTSWGGLCRPSLRPQSSCESGPCPGYGGYKRKRGNKVSCPRTGRAVAG